MALLHCVFHINTTFMRDERLLTFVTDSVTKATKPLGYKPTVKYPDILCGRANDSISKGKTSLFIGTTDISGCIDEQHLENFTRLLSASVAGVSLREEKPVQIVGTLHDVQDDADELQFYHRTYDHSIDDIFASEFNQIGNFENADLITNRLLKRCFIPTRLHYLGWQEGDPLITYLRTEWQRCMSEKKISVARSGDTPLARWNANGKMKIVAMK